MSLKRRFNPFKKTYGLDEMEMLSFLGELLLFSDLTTDERALFLPHLHKRTYEKDEVVFLRNDPAHALYIVARGEVMLTLDQDEETEEIMRVDKGSIIGETSILKNKKRFVNAVVKSEKATLFVLPQVSIHDIFSSHAKIKVKMLEAVSNLYHDLNQDILKTYQNSHGFFYMSNVYNRK
ncbi:MAG: cyclic nucleotide-binding domain-containing protein [Cyclobacteriaceae bacterium]|nr:cyclic nucleotide-binding domain-containing protein [Cyclobacteriaceae bacterium]